MLSITDKIYFFSMFTAYVIVTVIDNTYNSKKEFKLQLRLFKLVDLATALVCPNSVHNYARESLYFSHAA